MPDKRFRIAFSFTGERRDYVAKVAALLAERFGEDGILYDKYHEAEFARNDLGIYLPKLYNEQADLIVAVVCPKYDEKDWTGLEWLAIHALLQKREREKVLLSRFDKSKVDGLFAGAGYIELDDKTPEQFVALILQRLALNEGLPKNHYLDAAKPRTTTAADPPSNLPGGYIGQTFVGREEFLKDLHSSLRKQTHATAITQSMGRQQQPAATVAEGLGGLGKTHAAVEYAHRHREEYSALLFVSGDSPQKLQSSLASLCEVKGLSLDKDLPNEEEKRAKIALHWLASNKRWLLIVDNVDDEESAQALTAHFDQLRHGHVLITSRLHHWSRQVDSLDLSVLSTEDGADLLLQLTDKRRRKAADDDTQARTLADLMEGLPLALHQAAGYINENACTLAQYLTAYQSEAKKLLNYFDAQIIPYERPDKKVPRPVYITWKTSFDQLSEDARRWLLVFSHFSPDPIPEFLLEGADKARRLTLPLLSRLIESMKCIFKPEANVSKSLALMAKLGLIKRYTDGRPRFKMHRLVQDVTRLMSPHDQCRASIAVGFRLLHLHDPGDAQDVRTWEKWNQLQSHALRICEYVNDDTAPQEVIWLLSSLSILLKSKAKYLEAEPLVRRALRIEEKRHGAGSPNAADILNNLASLLQETDQIKEAEELMRRALKIDESNHGGKHPSVASSLNSLAQLLKATNRMREAEPMMRKALEIDETYYGLEHPAVARDLNNLAQLLKETGRLGDAENLMCRAIKIDIKNYGSNHTKIATRFNNLAQLYQTTGRHNEAEVLLKKALVIDESNYGSNHPKVAIRLNNIAQLFQSTNRYEEAEPLLVRALKIDESSHGVMHPTVAINLNNLAQLFKNTGRSLDAEPLMHRALKIFVRSRGLGHPNSQAVCGNYFRLLRALNLPEAEIEKRVREAVGGGAGEG